MIVMVTTGQARSRPRLLTTAVVVALIAGVLVFLYQPPVAQWGSTGAERASALIGDDVVVAADTV